MKHGSIKIENNLSTREVSVLLYTREGKLLTGINVETQACIELMSFFFIAVSQEDFKGKSTGKLTDNADYISEVEIEAERLSHDVFDLSFRINKEDKVTGIKEEFKYARCDIPVEHIWLIIKIFCPLYIPILTPKDVTISWNSESQIPMFAVDSSQFSINNLLRG